MPVGVPNQIRNSHVADPPSHGLRNLPRKLQFIGAMTVDPRVGHVLTARKGISIYPKISTKLAVTVTVLAAFAVPHLACTSIGKEFVVLIAVNAPLVASAP